MKHFLFIIIFFSYSSLVSQVRDFPNGEIVDSIAVSKTFNETFALYLPTNYKPNTLSPVVFIFDPAARGKTGIKPFIKAAEKYNYVLICSNNSKNGPYDQNFKIANRLFDKIFSDFSINPKRIYTAGFSGGARLASRIAVLNEHIQGVIACGAGIDSNQILFHKDIQFSYAAIVGDGDMNLLEMYKMKDYLTKFKVSNELFVNDMDHKWPSQEQILEAFDWMQLEAYKKGLAKRNDKNIESSYINYYKKARKLESDHKLVYAQEAYERINNNFNFYYQLDSIKEKLNTLRVNKTLLKEKKELKAIFEQETSLSKMFIDRFYSDIEKDNPKLKWWDSEINKLKKQEKTSDHNQKKMLHRLQYKIFATAIEEVNLREVIKNSNQVIFCYDICILIYPGYYFPYFKQIENYINQNNEDMAIHYLEKMLNSGYDDINTIREYKAFDSLKKNERFKALINN